MKVAMQFFVVASVTTMVTAVDVEGTLHGAVESRGLSVSVVMTHEVK